MSAKSKDDAEKSWNVLRRDTENRSAALTDGEPFNFYVHWAGETDPTSAPPGHEAVMVLVPCQGLQRNQALASFSRDEAIEIYKNQFDEKVVSSIREAVLARLAVVEGLKDLKEYIVDEVIDTPITYADYYNLAAGVPFGLVREPWFYIPEALCGFAATEFTFTFFINITQSHGLRQLSLTRPGAESSSRDNVLYVGASSRPGNGVPLVLIGAKAVSHQEHEICHNDVSMLCYLLYLSFFALLNNLRLLRRRFKD
jgi:phytoene desaturase (3,4-didehydrolycopene-forming)